MLKVFSMLKRPEAHADGSRGPSFCWLRDPLQHPDLARMDERELADLPFPGWPWLRPAVEVYCERR